MTKNYVTLIFSFCLSIFFNSPAVAQSETGTIKGSVIDSVTNKPIDFMTVALKRNNAVIKTVVVNNAGNFSFEKMAPGQYTVTAIAIGYNAKNIPVILNPAKGPADLGNILMVSQSNNLKEVSVTADRPLIKQEIDRISYDIQADPESKGLTVLDMMRKVPLLSLDADDNIKLKGSGNYKILINGKPSTMVARSPKDVLRSMPASSILKIEVITTPPAKYDSEGLSGIINIITSKKVDNGYNGSLNLRYQGPVGGPGLGGFLTIKQGKLGVTAYGGTGFYSSPETESSTTRTTTGDLPTSLLSSGFRKFNNNYRYGGVELSYEIDTLNLITVELNPYGGYNKSHTRQLYSLLNGTQQTGYSQLGTNRFGWNGFDATVNYQLGFKGHKDRLLTFSYKNGNSGNPLENQFSFINRTNFTDPDYNQKNNSRTQEQTLQVDYIHPLAKITVEGGIKGILRTNKSIFEYESLDAVTGQFHIDPTRTNKFNNNQNVIGVYNSYAYNLKDWGFKAGIRAEATFVKADFISTGSNVNTDYFNLIPTLSVNRKFKDMSNLNFGYTQRIERPGIDNLNPFVDRSNPNFLTTGNPDLKAVLSNNFELTYSKFKKGSINVGLSYNFANNTIQEVAVYNETDQITRTTFFNIGKDKTLATNLNINYPITPKWNVSLSGNVGYKRIQGSINGQITKNDGLTGYAYMNTGYKFEHGWKANASFNYNAPQIQLQGQNSAYFFSSFSGSKEIIKDKLTLSAGVNNVFSKFRYYTNFTEGANFKQNYRSQNYNRSFNVSLNWRFGKLKDSIKKNQRGIDNNDVKKSNTSGS
jgi:outer membrane receptor protein involved in Fe transport